VLFNAHRGWREEDQGRGGRRNVGDEAVTGKLARQLWSLAVGQAGGLSPWNGEGERGHVGSRMVIGGARLISYI
jgi:hypothetical protein